MDSHNYGRAKFLPSEGLHLCASCKSLLTFDGLMSACSTRGFIHSTVGDHMSKIRSIPSRSIHKSCAICCWRVDNLAGYSEASSLVFKARMSTDEGDALFSVEPEKRRFGLAPFDKLIVGAQEPDDDEGNSFQQINVDFILVAPFDDPASDFILRRPPLRDPFTPTVTSAVHAWLNECQLKHDKCPGNVLPELPTRVLDVNPDTICDPGTIKLHIPVSGECARYACLSYCWGGPQAVVATTKTLMTLVNGLNFRCLGQTIQDAVQVTKAMGTRYLWVDALCILQDNPSDKASEIGKMGSIYKNCTYTIAASSASTSSSGFLYTESRPNQPAQVKCFHIQISLPDGAVGNFFIQFEFNFIDNPDPLDTRGWTLQEYLLLPRILNFTSDQLLVECRHDYHRQLYKTNLVYGDKGSTRYYFLKSSESKESWLKLVEEFTRRSLTEPEDRLSAINGIALEIAGQSNLRGYAFGLQEFMFVPQLSWRVEKQENVIQKAGRAPTWSWASMNSAIIYPSWRNLQIKAKLESPVSSDSRQIKLMGRVLRRWDAIKVKSDIWLDTAQDFSKTSLEVVLFLLCRDFKVPSMRWYYMSLMLAGKAFDGKDMLYQRIGLVTFIDYTIWEKTVEETVLIV